MKYEQKKKKWLKTFFDKDFELGSKTENKFRENTRKSWNENIFGKFVDDRRKRKTMVTARTAEECNRRQSKVTYEQYRQHETEDGGDPFTICSLDKREIAISQPLQIVDSI